VHGRLVPNPGDVAGRQPHGDVWRTRAPSGWTRKGAALSARRTRCAPRLGRSLRSLPPLRCLRRPPSPRARGLSSPRSSHLHTGQT
jgi:hypothetical protein